MTSAFSIDYSRFSFLVVVLCTASSLSMACTKHKLIPTPGIDGSSAIDSGSGTDRGTETAGTGGAGGAYGTGGALGTGGLAQTDGGIVPDAQTGSDGVVPCVSDQKRCNGVCVAINDPTYGCDTATCDVSGCPAIPGATLVCQGSLCVVGTCGAGTKKCGARCVDVNDPAYGCGASTCDASTCPNPGAGGSVSCQAGVCVIATCAAGTKKCANRCVAVTDPTFGCGASTCDASTCPSAGTGTLICQAGACVVGSCGAGTKKCGNNCVPTDANNGCGDTARCTPCASTETCVGTPIAQCQCVPVAVTVTCAGKACGTATGNCGQAVPCPNTCTGVNTCGGGSAGPNGCGCTPPVSMTTACAGKCGSIPNGCGGSYACGTCAAGQKCDPASSVCVANCTGVTCGTNLKCDPATGGCVDICTGGGPGTASHCCLDTDCPTAPACKVATCNTANRTCSTTNKGQGAVDAACPTSVATCQAGGCNGLGACLAAPAATPCAAYVCANSSEIQGQYSAIDRRRKVCDGTLGAAACKTGNNDGCQGSVICGDSTNCKTGCAGDGDCVSGFYCAGATGCSQRRAVGAACATDHECASRVCFNNSCVECITDNYCPQNRHHCAGGLCTFFGYPPIDDGNGNLLPGNNPDGTPTCVPLGVTSQSFGEVVCSSGAPTCLSNNKCVCGTSGDCANGTICVGGSCKIDGRQACVSNTECASGVCTLGMCTPTGDGVVCRGSDSTTSTIRGGCANFCYNGDLTGVEFCGAPR